MAIPDFQTIMLLLLKFPVTKGAFQRETIDALAEEFGLTEEEKKNYYLVVSVVFLIESVGQRLIPRKQAC